MGLIKPAWQSDNKEKALRAVEKETSMEVITKMIQKAVLSEVRQAADEKLKRITDLLIIANKELDKHQFSSMEYLDRTSSQSLVEHFRYASREAISKISSQSVLADIAKNATDSGSQEAALAKITAPEMLLDIIKNVIDPFVCNSAIKSLLNLNATLENLADNCVGVLIVLYEKSPEGGGHATDHIFSKRIKQIGERLANVGGFDLMKRVHENFSSSYSVYGAVRNLEMCWDGIAGWAG